MAIVRTPGMGAMLVQITVLIYNSKHIVSEKLKENHSTPISTFRG
jgi:hypothetical protein